jgi:hypothetical protein
MTYDMTRRLSLAEHGAVELLGGVLLIAAPLVLGFGPNGFVAAFVAGALLAGLGLADGLSISRHMAADMALAIGMVAAAAGLASAGEAVPAALLAGAAAVELALTSGTRWTRRA